MGHRSLKDIIRNVLSAGVALGAATRSLQAMPPVLSASDPDAPRGEMGMNSAKGSELVIRPSRPRVLLRALDGSRVALISSHRSHRSHSSHRSSSTGRGSPPPVPPTKKKSPAPSGGTGKGGAQSLMSAVDDTNSLGKRVLRLGMSGKDVDELILLLVKGELLTATEIPQESLFTDAVERAVKKFQAVKGIPENGLVDYRTLLLLRLP